MTEKKRLVIIGAAPTGLGFAYRLNELLAEQNEDAKNVELTILEKVYYLLKIIILINFRNLLLVVFLTLRLMRRVLSGTWEDTLPSVRTALTTKRLLVGPLKTGTLFNVTVWLT